MALRSKYKTMDNVIIQLCTSLYNMRVVILYMTLLTFIVSAACSLFPGASTDTAIVPWKQIMIIVGLYKNSTIIAVDPYSSMIVKTTI